MVIGGGSTGVYTGIKLSDTGKSVIIVEPKATIGGHTETYTDPKSGTKINLGVQIFHNISVVTNWFSRWKCCPSRQQYIAHEQVCRFCDGIDEI